MENSGTKLQDSSSLSPWRSLLILIIYFFIGMFVGQFVGSLLAMLLFGLGFEEVMQAASNYLAAPNGKYILYCIQFGSALGAFIGAPLFFLRRHGHAPVSALFNKKSRHIIPILLTIFITLAFMTVNSILIEWNSNITLPSGFERVEKILQEQEEQLRQLTEYLTQFASFGDFLIAFVIIAIIPAVGEELLFRGLIQTNLARALRNPHLAIWLTAFIFGAIHFQFYGLVPRLFLGAIFGYLYYWSGSLLLPMIAHFVNNGFSLIMLYLHQQGVIQYDVTETQALPYSSILVFLLLGIFAFGLFHRYFRSSKEESV